MQEQVFTSRWTVPGIAGILPALEQAGRLRSQGFPPRL